MATRMSRLALAVVLMLVAVGIFWYEGNRRAERDEPRVDRMTESEKVGHMVGTFAYMADAGSFTDCPTAIGYPVAHEGDNASLERAYLSAPVTPPEPVLVTFYGHVAERPAIDGDGTAEFMIVDRFVDIWPDEDCSKSGVRTSLTNTYWKLVEIGGVAVSAHSDQREVHMLLEVGENKVRGFAGCNQFFGNYETTGDSLRLGRLASTQMACPYLDEETAFLNSLGKAKTYSIMGESLKLSDGSRVVARFKAVYF